MTVYIASYRETYSSKYICHVYYDTITKVFAFFFNSNVSHRIYSAGKWSSQLNEQYYIEHDITESHFISYENSLDMGYLNNLLLEKIILNKYLFILNITLPLLYIHLKSIARQ